MAYNKRPSRHWLLSGRISREGIPLWYSVPRNQHEEIDDQTTAQPVLDDLIHGGIETIAIEYRLK